MNAIIVLDSLRVVRYMILRGEEKIRHYAPSVLWANPRDFVMNSVERLSEVIMSGINEISLNFAVEMANKLHKHGTPMGLAIYKAAKYYRIEQHNLAVEIGKHSVAHQVRPKCHELKSQVKYEQIRLRKAMAEQAYWWDR